MLCIAASDWTPGHLLICVDNQAALQTLVGATKTYQRGASITISWVPGHVGVIGNEVAGRWAVDAATREMRACKGRGTSQAILRPDRMVSGTFLKTTLRRRAVSAWRDGIIQRGRGGRPYRNPGEGEVPRIPRLLRGTNRELASRFSQLASGHAMIAPFLREKFGWVESDLCWWCCSDRQNREHLFKECRTWKEEIRLLWKKVGDISGEAGIGAERTRKRKRNKGFMLGSTRGRIGPGSCSIGRLFSDSRFTEGVLEFLASTGVGKVKKGVNVRGEAVE